MRNLLCSLMALGILAFTNTHAQTELNPGILARKTQTSLNETIQKRISEIASTEAETFINQVQHIIDTQSAKEAKQMIYEIAAIEIDRIVSRYADIVQTSYQLTKSERDEAARLLAEELHEIIYSTLDIMLVSNKAKTDNEGNLSEAVKYQILIAVLASQLKAQKEADGVLMSMLLTGIFDDGVELAVTIFPQIIVNSADISARDFAMRLGHMGFSDQHLASIESELKKALVKDMTLHCQSVLSDIIAKYGMKNVAKPLNDYLEKKYPGALKELENKIKKGLEKKEQEQEQILKPDWKKQA